MADQFSSEVQPIVPEQDLAAVAEEVERHRERPELSNLTGYELVRKSIQTLPSPVPDGVAPGDDLQLPAYVIAAAPATKLEVEQLLSLAFQEGILKASAEAAKTNPFVLDAFHDALAGKLYPELKKRGVVD